MGGWQEVEVGDCGWSGEGAVGCQSAEASIGVQLISSVVESKPDKPIRIP